MAKANVDAIMRNMKWIPNAPCVSMSVNIPGEISLGRTVSLVPRAYTIDEFCDFLAVQSVKMRQRLEDWVDY